MKRKMPEYHGMAAFVHRFNDPMAEPVKQDTKEEVLARQKAKRQKVAEETLEDTIAKWDPKANENPEVTGDAYKTLFVARLDYNVTAEELKEEFEYYGQVNKVSVVHDKEGKSRGFAFVEFESSRDLKEAYKDADGRKINNRRIVVDVERGRTVTNWKPRKLGGGLGGTRMGGDDVNVKFSGREPPPRGAAGAGQGDRPNNGGDRRDRGPPRGGDRDRRGGDRERGGRDDKRDARGGGGRDRERGRERDRDRERKGGERGRDRDREREPRKDKDKDDAGGRDRDRDRERRSKREGESKREEKRE